MNEVVVNATSLALQNEIVTRGTFISVRVCLSYSVLQLLEGGDLTKLKTNWWYDRSECGKGELQVMFFVTRKYFVVPRHFFSTLAQSIGGTLWCITTHITFLLTLVRCMFKISRYN